MNNNLKLTETTWKAIAESENITPKNWLNMIPSSTDAKLSVNLKIRMGEISSVNKFNIKKTELVS